MPTDVDALLAYGFDLGGPGHWNLRGAVDGEYEFPWWNAVNGEDGEFQEAVLEQLDIARRTRSDIDIPNIDVVWYGSDTRHSVGIGYILAAGRYSTYFSDAIRIPPISRDQESIWARRLGLALDILAIEPVMAGFPSWILAASHGI